MGGISGEVLLRLGAKSPYILVGQWWRLVTAIFLHAGLLHIGMNLWCLFDLGPEVESLFSTAKFMVFYLVTGVLGFVLSLWWRPMGMSIGASGAVCGLIGVLIGASFHHGHLGKAYRGQLWRWVIYIAIFGIFLPIDNAAHFGGLIAGIAPGLPGAGRRRGDASQPEPLERPRRVVRRNHRRLVCPHGFAIGPTDSLVLAHPSKLHTGLSFRVQMDLRPTHGDESACHPERSEGSAVPVRCERMQILRFAQNDSGSGRVSNTV